MAPNTVKDHTLLIFGTSDFLPLEYEGTMILHHIRNHSHTQTTPHPTSNKIKILNLKCYLKFISDISTVISFPKELQLIITTGMFEQNCITQTTL